MNAGDHFTLTVAFGEKITNSNAINRGIEAGKRFYKGQKWMGKFAPFIIVRRALFRISGKGETKGRARASNFHWGNNFSRERLEHRANKRLVCYEIRNPRHETLAFGIIAGCPWLLRPYSSICKTPIRVARRRRRGINRNKFRDLLGKGYERVGEESCLLVST